MKVAINGFGRIGRLVFRIMEEDDDFDIVAINNMSGSQQAAYLLKYDSIHGSYKTDDITYDDKNIIVNKRSIKVFSEKDPKNLPWKELDIDVILECSGHFTNLDDALKHIEAGAKKVVVSAPCKGDVKTVVYGVNENILDGNEKVISAASCTTNCLAPVLKVLNDNFGIEKGFMTTVHAYTNDQGLLDSSHNKDIKERRGRAGAMNIVPTSTGAAKAIGKVIPEIDGKISGSSIRVPVSDGSLIDLSLELNQKVNVDTINKAFVDSKSEVLGITYDQIVSSDIIGSFNGGVVDLSLTDVVEVNGKQLVKVVAWYDNEFGYSNQMVRTVKHFFDIEKSDFL